MDIGHAKTVLSALADGVNPLTGELLPSDCVCNQVEVVRAFHCILNALSRVGEKDVPSNAGMPWTESEDEHLLNSFKDGKTVAELAKMHGRTKGAISSRLKKIAEIEIDDFLSLEIKDKE